MTQQTLLCLHPVEEVHTSSSIIMSQSVWKLFHCWWILWQKMAFSPLIEDNGMSSIKFVACQAKYINQYKNLRIKVLKCCANIHFNRQCLKQGLIPKYANIRIPHTSPASNVTQRKAQTMCVKEEIKHFYKKKETLNTLLYNTHLQAAKEWENSWHLIQESLHNTINQEFEKKYKILDDKISRLASAQKQKVDKSNEFYQRVINKTNIDFSKEELNLLNKGLKHNLGHKHRHWINNLAFEAESAIALLPPGEQEHMHHQVAQNIKKLQNQQLHQTHILPKIKEALKLVNLIKDKLRKNKALIMKADKGNVVVVVYREDYDQKVIQFISGNRATEVNDNITTEFSPT